MLAVGAPYNKGGGTDAGHVRVYNYTGTGWTQLGSDIDGEAAGDLSGHSVSLSGDGKVSRLHSAEPAQQRLGARLPTLSSPEHSL